MSAVSFLSTKIWTFMLAAWSARRGNRNARSLSMFLLDEMQISFPKMIFYVPNIHPPMETLALLI